MAYTSGHLITPIIVEFQGFYDDNGGYIIKELAVIDVVNKYFLVQHYKDPNIDISANTSKTIRSSHWLTQNLHGLRRDEGATPYCLENIKDTCLAYISDWDDWKNTIIYTRGLEKKRYFDYLLGERVKQVVDINSLGFKKPNPTPEEKIQCPLKAHQVDNTLKCALKTAIENSEWLNEHEQLTGFRFKKAVSYNNKTKETADYSNEDQRYDSFNFWPEDTFFLPNTRRLANCGFYFDKFSQCISCFKCNKQICLATPDVCSEHFVETCKGKNSYAHNSPTAISGGHYF